MFKKITIKNFRGIKDLTIDDFGKVNLFVGANNSCKTSVLEALKIAYSKQVFDEAIFLNNQTRDFGLFLNNSSNPLETLNMVHRHLSNYFYQLNFSEKITIKSTFTNSITTEETIETINLRAVDKKIVKGQVYEWQSAFKPSELSREITSFLKFQSPFVNNVEISIDPQMQEFTKYNSYLFNGASHLLGFVKDYYKKVLENKAEKNLIALLQKVDKSIKDIYFDGENFLVDIGLEKNRIDGRLMGDGIKIIFILTLIILSETVDNGVLFIDEIENGLHYTSQNILWKFLFEIAEEKNIQIFATTHSMDAVRAFTQIAKEKQEENIRLFRLVKKNEEIKVFKSDLEILEISAERDGELR